MSILEEMAYIDILLKEKENISPATPLPTEDQTKPENPLIKK